MLRKWMDKLTSRPPLPELDGGQFHELEDLSRLGAVAVEAKGRTITEVYVDLQNRSEQTLKVVISPGTYFVAKGQHQNMVTRREQVIRLPAMGRRYLTVDVACINAHRAIPGETDNFRGVKRTHPDVERYLVASAKESPMTVQAGVWMLTDGLSRQELKNRMTTTDPTSGTRPSIDDFHIDSAKAILSELGIL